MILTEAQLIITLITDTAAAPPPIKLILSDYGDYEEFYSESILLFSMCENPLFRFSEWENIPCELISEYELSPNFFAVRDAVDLLEEEDAKHFFKWCKHHRHDLKTDDPYVLVNYYLNTQQSGYEYIEHELIKDNKLLLLENFEEYYENNI